MKRIRVIDSHTGGEPTRVVVEGGPDLGTGPMAERLLCFRDRFDLFRSAVVNEPRGSDTLVGALLCEPCKADSAAGVIFFNNVGYLGMCGHGAIGVVSTLGYLGRIRPGRHRLETPAGAIAAGLQESGEVVIENVASYRWAKGVALDLEGYGRLTGDVAWGGNWFFLSEDHGLQLREDDIDRLLDCSWTIRRELRNRGITGKGGREIDHIGLYAPPRRTDADARNFVLCPRGLLRPLTLRNRHLCQGRLPGCRRPLRPGTDLAAGEHHRQPVRGHGPPRPRSHPAVHQGFRFRHRRGHPAAGSSRSDEDGTKNPHFSPGRC